MTIEELLENLRNKIADKAIDANEIKSMAYSAEQKEMAECAEYDVHIWQEVLEFLEEVANEEVF